MVPESHKLERNFHEILNLRENKKKFSRKSRKGNEKVIPYSAIQASGRIFPLHSLSIRQLTRQRNPSTASPRAPLPGLPAARAAPSPPASPPTPRLLRRANRAHGHPSKTSDHDCR